MSPPKILYIPVLGHYVSFKAHFTGKIQKQGRQNKPTDMKSKGRALANGYEQGKCPNRTTVQMYRQTIEETQIVKGQ